MLVLVEFTLSSTALIHTHGVKLCIVHTLIFVAVQLRHRAVVTEKEQKYLIEFALSNSARTG